MRWQTCNIYTLKNITCNTPGIHLSPAFAKNYNYVRI